MFTSFVHQYQLYSGQDNADLKRLMFGFCEMVPFQNCLSSGEGVREIPVKQAPFLFDFSF